MESQMKRGLFWLLAISVLASPSNALAAAPENVPSGPEISLRKAVNTRQFQGKEIEGVDREVAPGDSLWRILVEEKGVSGKQFRSYVVIIRGLNPQIKNLDVLRVGDKIFIPLQTEQLVKSASPGEVFVTDKAQPAKGLTNNYRIKAGEHLYQILREQLKVSDERKVAQYYALVKDLNPERKNWDTLLEGETIRLPVVGQSYETPALAAAPLKPIAEPAVAGQKKGRSRSEADRGG